MYRISHLHKSTQYRLYLERYVHLASIASALCLVALLAYVHLNPHLKFSLGHFAAASLLALSISALSLILLADNWKLVADIGLSEKTLWEAKSLIDLETDERIRNIRDSQMDKVRAMYRLIEFGRISSGIFHDISSPLTSLVIELENPKSLGDISQNQHIPKALSKLQYLVANARKHIQLTNTEERFDVRSEIASVIDLLTAKALLAGASMTLAPGKKAALFGNKALFCHIIANLISNAIDAYEGLEGGDKGERRKPVRIYVHANRSHVRIRVTDRGKGIPAELMEKIFETFFTTKHQSGCGIGLSSSRYSLEKYFNGKMTASSASGMTAFDVRIPKPKKQKP